MGWKKTTAFELPLDYFRNYSLQPPGSFGRAQGLGLGVGDEALGFKASEGLGSRGL